VSYSQSDLDALDAAIKSNLLEVEMAGRRVRYRSMDELMTARAHVAQQLSEAQASAAGTRRATRRYNFQTMRGD
jgi:hypothetical protein